MLVERYKEDIKYLHHQIKNKGLTPDETLVKEDVLTNQAKAKIISLKSTWQAEADRAARLDELKQIHGPCIAVSHSIYTDTLIHNRIQELTQPSAGEAGDARD